MAGRVPARRLSLANSAGIALGADYAFDLTRPGLALYGGVPRRRARGRDRAGRAPAGADPPAPPRRVRARRSATTRPGPRPRDTEVAILNIGYADGYLRGFSGRGPGARRRCGAAGDRARVDGPDRGRRDRPRRSPRATGSRSTYDLPRAAAASGMSQYELLTGARAGGMRDGLGVAAASVTPDLFRSDGVLRLPAFNPAPRTSRCPCRRRCTASRAPSSRRACPSRRSASSARARRSRRSGGRSRSRRR